MMYLLYTNDVLLYTNAVFIINMYTRSASFTSVKMKMYRYISAP